MYIGVLLKNLYGENLNWWMIHFLHFCVRYGSPLITNREFLTYPLKFNLEQEKKYETCSISDDMLKQVELYCVSDELYQTERGMSTKISIHLFTERDLNFEEFLNSTINQIHYKHKNTKIEGFLIFGQGYYSLEYFAKERGYNIIRSDMAPIRMMDGYTQSLLWATMNSPLYGASQCRERYEKFCKEKSELPVMTRAELIAMFGKRETLPLIPLMYARPQYEMGICETRALQS